MNSQQMIGLKIMLTCSLVAAVSSAMWTLLPSREGWGYTGTISLPSGTNGESRLAEARPKVLEFPGMDVWTKPPPVVEPPVPPAPLRLNAELLSIRDSEEKAERMATLYLVETGEIIRLRIGDSVGDLRVEEITIDGVRFRRDEQTLVIKPRQ